jgi:putative intracellular protease/amidase
MHILMALASHDQLGNTGKKTGFWLEEFAAPYPVVKDAGARVTLVSPQGDEPPLDPKSDEPDAQTEAAGRFKADSDAQHALVHTGMRADVNAAEYDAVFDPGGHGPLWDLAQDPHSLQLIQQMLQADKTVAAVCHAPGELWRAKVADGASVVQGKRVTGFTDSEEDALGPDRGGAVSGARPAGRKRRCVQQGRRLAAPRGDRRCAHHQPEPGLVRAGRACAAGPPGHTRSHP